MRYALPVTVAFAALQAAAHPFDTRNVARRAIDVQRFRLKTEAAYTNATVAAENSFGLKKRADYVETATELVKSVFPNATFRVVGDNYVGKNGIGHVNFKQTAHGIDIDNADFNVNVAKDGSIFSYGNSFYTGSVPETSPLKKRDFVDPVDALKGATNTLTLPITTDNVAAQAEGDETYTLTGTTGAEKDPKARLVYFAEDGNLRLSWRVETDVFTNWLLTYTDASNPSEVVGVVDYDNSATYQVYPWGTNDPTEGDRVIVTDPFDKTASPNGWHNDGSTTYTSTRGNNGIAHTNWNGGTAYLTNPRPDSATSKFEYPFSLSTVNYQDYANASVTQLFYTSNKFHDLLYHLGFTESAGNFQVSNLGKGGSGNDFVILNGQDGSGTNNANFATPPDGQPGRMRMYIWNRSTPNRDGSFEAGIVLHEYTHGLSNRLTGGPANSGCLSTAEAGGMGEGWSDFYPTVIRLKPGDTRAKDYPLAVWAYNDARGIRAYPYSTSLTTNPYTYKSANSLNSAVHAIGTVWASILYEVLWNLIDQYGSNPADLPTYDSKGVATDGRYLALQLVTDGLALQPCSPTFISARDAILDADNNLTGGVNKCLLWKGFAKRGLGTGASRGSGTNNRVESFVLPTECQ